MKKPVQLECACAHCGDQIDYSSEEIGEIIECPNCKKKSRLPKPKPALEPPPEKLPRKLGPPGKPQFLPWLLAFGVALLGIGGVALLMQQRPPLPVSAKTKATPSAPTTPPTALPQPKVKTPKSLNDLKIGHFFLEKHNDRDLQTAAGDIQNVSENLHRGVKIELEVLDAQGLKIGTLNASITELAPHATWRVLASTTDQRAATVRVAGIKEEH